MMILARVAVSPNWMLVAALYLSCSQESGNNLLILLYAKKLINSCIHIVCKLYLILCMMTALINHLICVCSVWSHVFFIVMEIQSSSLCLHEDLHTLSTGCHTSTHVDNPSSSQSRQIIFSIVSLSISISQRQENNDLLFLFLRVEICLPTELMLNV